MSTSFFAPQKFNSTTYSDQLSVLMGLYQDRQAGETADLFLDRLYSAAYSRRDHTMEGTINEISDLLGLNIQAGILVTPANPSTVIQVSAGQITLTLGTAIATIPTVTITPDGFWSWNYLSSVVDSINSQTIVPVVATLQIPDTYAIQLVPQSSLGCSLSEPIEGTTIQLKYSGVAVGSELFNNPVPPYTLSSNGSLVFTSAVPSNTTVCYIYNLSPFILTCSEVSVINLMDPALATTAKCPNGAIVYQVREFNQDILAQDPSYWQ